MADYLRMLALSPTMEKGTIASWHKAEGDAVASGDVLCEVETDKATMEYESMDEGTLLKILLPDGGRAAVGDPIGILGDEGEDVSDLVKEFESTPSSDAEGDGSSDADEGSSDADEDREQKDDAPQPKAGKGGGSAAPAAPSGGASRSGGKRLRSTPLARKIAAENGLDLRAIEGSGPSGRIIKRDVEAALKSQPTGSAAATAGEGDRSEPLSERRRVIAERLSSSFFSAPHYYLKKSVEVDGLFAARARLNQKNEVKAGFNAFLMKLSAEALKRHPEVNSGWGEDALVRRASVDIGLAVALPGGLVTPVVRDCGTKTIREIDDELRDLVARGREGKLDAAEYSGNSFTISNLGSYGIDEFTAIINPPASAILAVGQAVKQPVVEDDDTLRVAQVLRLTLGCDHRVIDGAVGAAFLAHLAELIEDPMAALF